ncbi:MAG: hypothetical protein IJX72_00420 [Clostridia bacterium]|nr:hypothetical protein [Clostridia bacterium]
MQITVSHPTYGLITYEESAWTGKKTILFDGIPLVKIKKNTFQLPADPAKEDSSPLTVTVKGGYVSGVTLLVGDEVIPVTQKASALDIVLGIIPAILFFSLVIGGAIGGAIGGMMAIGGILIMKSCKKTIHKILICVGASAVILAIGIPLLLIALSQL